MKSENSSRFTLRFGLAMAIAVLSILLATPTALFAQQGDQNNWVYPPDSVVFGMTYGDWLAAYWQYILAFPASANPATDTTGAICNLGQSGGPVFFLNGSFASGVLITRSCTVPAGKALYIPNVGCECSTAESAPFHGDTGQEMRACTLAFTDGIDVRTLKVTVDHKKIQNLGSYRAQSPLYNFIMPADDNILGVPGVSSGSSVADEYGVILKPLSPGFHVIHFEGAFVTGPGAGASFSVTYYLTVQ